MNDWDPESAGLLQDDGSFICGYPIGYDEEEGHTIRCQRPVGEDWSPCWQHEEE